MSDPFRCAARSLARDEPLAGTASTVRAFLMIEVPGPWGEDALHDSRLPDEVKTGLARHIKQAGVRPLLIRRHGRSEPDGCRVFTGYADPVNPWLETATLNDPHELLDVDLSGLRVGRSTGLTPHDAPVFLVCTHGRHDACCAERGRPVAAALCGVFPDETWEVSHIGGDRFAGNVLVLPHGLYYGRVEASSAATLAAEHTAGRLDLERLRGRSGHGFAVQAAEIFLRRRLELPENDALRLTGHERAGQDTTAVFAGRDGAWTVQVRTTAAAPALLTCRAGVENNPPVHELLSITDA